MFRTPREQRVDGPGFSGALISPALLERGAPGLKTLMLPCMSDFTGVNATDPRTSARRPSNKLSDCSSVDNTSTHTE